MVEQGMSVYGTKLMSPVIEVSPQPHSLFSSYHPYPAPMAEYDDIVGSVDLFMDTLRKLHAFMGTKFMIPVVGGRDLDLHRLFVEVTSRGGIVKVVKEKKWKEVTAGFKFPSSATNASFILRKYYISLLYHYEQIHFFKAKCWVPLSPDELQQIPEPPRFHSPGETDNAPLNEVSLGSPVVGVIDGKFDSGYLVTVKLGSEELKGVLYQVPPGSDTDPPVWLESGQSMKCRRRRRKKFEIKKRDPSHPKPNRSGYNFFFAEQHAKLKPLYHGRDREISRIIGQSWNKLQESDRTVYQEQALKDKERYRTEMEVYRKKLRTGEVVTGGSGTQIPESTFVQNAADSEMIFDNEMVMDQEDADGTPKSVNAEMMTDAEEEEENEKAAGTTSMDDKVHQKVTENVAELVTMDLGRTGSQGFHQL